MMANHDCLFLKKPMNHFEMNNPAKKNLLVGPPEF